MDFMDNFKPITSQEGLNCVIFPIKASNSQKLLHLCCNYLKAVFVILILKGQIWYCACSCVLFVARSNGLIAIILLEGKVGFHNASQLHIICCYRDEKPPLLFIPPLLHLTPLFLFSLVNCDNPSFVHFILVLLSHPQHLWNGF